jgi:hypothetical protein
MGYIVLPGWAHTNTGGGRIPPNLYRGLAERRRTFMSIVAGMVAGVLGLTNLAGFGAYAVMMLLVAGSLLLKCGGVPTTFFMRSAQISYEGVTAEAMTFVLFWTLFYDIVHIYG